MSVFKSVLQIGSMVGYGYGLFNVIYQYIHDYHLHGIEINTLVFMQLWCSSGSSHIGSTFFEYKEL